ncbi:Endonuclease/exonuclease/phosphatase [Macleaya cordata]|uniref:Endonuclease/exonuclease/phosphatase n=1 Tax=Macleaya cordata TaxID=56857 RepID=A0A200Q506_MACCD|nr:Endonuclease/exonuclease/phosphatase [Macleaya cordata]
MHVSAVNKDFIRRNVHYSWNFLDNDDSGTLGRIWVLWDPTLVNISLLFSSSQVITVMANLSNGSTFILSFIYGSNSLQERRDLWNYITSFAATNNTPWLLMGDFNSILHSNEKSGGDIVRPHHFSDFQDCVREAHLFDCPYLGCFFTWSNNQIVQGRISSKLDRALINFNWLNVFPDSKADFLTSGISDHSPCIFTIFPDHRGGPKPFRFFNCWAEEPDFLDLVKSAWEVRIRGTPMFRLVSKLKVLKDKLIVWKRDRFCNYSTQVQQAKSQMESLQRALQATPHCPILAANERQVVHVYASKYRKEGSMLHQKAKIKWMDQKDNNNTFFHNSIKERRSRNKILVLYDSAGTRLDIETDIATECVNYFTNIFGTDFDTDLDSSLFQQFHFNCSIQDDEAAKLIEPSLASVLRSFAACTGLVANTTKSMIFTAAIDDLTVETMRNLLEFSVGNLPVRYLGIPLLSSRLSYSDCLPLIDHVTCRIKSWKARILSYAGRLLLIKAVLSGMLIHWTTCFVLPKKVFHELTCIFRSFLWDGVDLKLKRPCISWDSICHPYSEGGLGIRNLQIANTATNLRHIWDIVSGKDTLWVAWVNKNLIKSRDFWTLNTPNEASWCWRRILEHRPIARNMIISCVGDGSKIRFWHDNWHPLGILLRRFPLALRFDSILHKEALVQACISDGEWAVPDHLVLNLGEIYNDLHAVPIDYLEEDRTVWAPAADGVYSLKDTYNSIRSFRPSNRWHKLVFFKHNIPRHSFISWVSLHRGLKTKSKLISWGIEVDPLCSFCRNSVEDDFHLIFGCCFSQFIWRYMLRCIGFTKGALQDWDFELSLCVNHFLGDSLAHSLYRLVFNAYIYHIWYEQNK